MPDGKPVPNFPDIAWEIFSRIMSRATLTLPEMPETATVREAKELACAVAGDCEPALVAFAMRMIFDRDLWFNTRRKAH